MLNTVQEWLMNKLGIVLNGKTPDSFGENVKNGYLISRILAGFEVITKEELSLIKSTEDPRDAMSNFLDYILIWLDRLDIRLSDRELQKVTDGDAEACLNIIFELYLALQDKSKLDFITQKRIKERLRNPAPKFDVKIVHESPIEHFTPEYNPIFKQVTENRDIIKWHKNRLAALNKYCEDARKYYEKYCKNMEEKSKPPKISCEICTPCTCKKDGKLKQSQIVLDVPEDASVDFTFEELMKQYKSSKKLGKFQENPEEARKYVESLKKRRREQKRNELSKTKIHTELCEKFWNDIVKNQEQQIEEHVDEKVMSQSFFEKQMMNKLLRVKHQQEVIKENRQIINDEIQKQIEDDIYQQSFMEQRNSNECLCDYLYEKQRIKMLHHRIYAEKQRLKKERIEKMCRETVQDIVKLSIVMSDYKKEHGEEPSRRTKDQWVSLFLKGGEIFPIVEPVEEILKIDSETTVESEVEMLDEEVQRQDLIDDKDFEKYCKYEWPWEITEKSLQELNSDLMERGLNIVGYIVHRLYAEKYPSNPVIIKPDFKFDHSVCITGIYNNTVIEKLQNLLALKEIVVFEVITAVNYCLEKFWTEKKAFEDDSKSTIEEVELNPRISATMKKSVKGMKGKKSISEDKPNTNLTLNTSQSSVNSPTAQNKMNQTPLNFPCEEVPMSHAAHLGEIAQSLLDCGEPITDFLMAAMIVEFLKSVANNAKGWALVNYPNTYNQTVTLEENLSAIPLHKDLGTYNSILDHIDLDHDYTERAFRRELNPKRFAKIFPKPQIIKDAESYETHLTAFIKNIRTEELADVQNADNELPPVKIYMEETTDPIEKFYADQGCLYLVYHEVFNFKTVKYLARLVIGDFSLPRKPSVELFGKAALAGEEEEEEEAPLLGDGSSKLVKSSRIINPSREKIKKKLVIPKENRDNDDDDPRKTKSGKLKPKSDSVLNFDHKEVQVPPLEDVYEIIIEEDDPSILPGQDKWKFIDIPISYEQIQTLVKMCESMEDLYIEDFKQVLFMRRTHLNMLQPYISMTRDYLLKFIDRPDHRQKILHDFQMTFNEIPECARDDDEVKAELHCRTNELRNALLATSEDNIMESFRERDRIIEQNWLRRQMHELCQIYICAMQLELNRFIDTLQLITDYYVLGITGVPNAEVPFQKEILRSPNSDDTRTIEHYSKWKDAYDTKFFNEKLSSKVRKAFDFIDKTINTSIKVIGSTQAISLGKSKLKKKKMNGGGMISESLIVVDMVRDKMDKIIDEWKTAIEGETERVELRLKLLRKDSEQRFREMSNRVREMMNDIYKTIRKRYSNEQSCIEQVCEVICAAIENETAIQVELLLNRDKFYVHPEVFLFPNEELPPPPPVVKEWMEEYAFSIEQLSNLKKVCADLAPKGTMPERMLTYLVQDMLIQDVEDGRKPLAPEMWRKLTSIELEKVMSELFVRADCVNWKDFIIHNLIMRMPTVEELLEMKREFRKIDKIGSENVPLSEFRKVTLWFENCARNEVEYRRVNGIKDLICDMYKVGPNLINYSAMLFDFCKGRNVIVGFAKLLALILDKPVCHEPITGKQYVKYHLMKRVEHDKEVAEREKEIVENVEFAKKLAAEIADETFHRCDSVVIKDYPITSDNLVGCENPCLCERTCFCDPKKESFTNIPINFEAGFEPALVYFLDKMTVLAAEATVLDFHLKVQNYDNQSFRQVVEETFVECRNPAFNNAVLAHEFLNHPKFSMLLAKTTRFADKNPINLIKNIISFRK